MTFTSSQIEAITQSVLRELASRGVALTAAQSFDVKKLAVSTETAGLPLNNKIVTEDTLTAAEAAGRNITLPAGAIITPSGHDYIRQNNVTIAGTASSVSATNETGVLIAIGGNSSATSAAGTANWAVVEAGCEFDAATKAKQHSSKRIVCEGGEASVTACLLNRNAGIRAAVITQNTDISLITSVMNPQVMVLDSSGWSFAALLRLFRTLAKECLNVPGDWKELS